MSHGIFEQEARDLLRGKITDAKFTKNALLGAYLAVLECAAVGNRLAPLIQGPDEPSLDAVQVLEELAKNPLSLAEWIQDAKSYIDGSRLQSITDMLKTAEDRLSYAIPNHKRAYSFCCFFEECPCWRWC